MCGFEMVASNSSTIVNHLYYLFVNAVLTNNLSASSFQTPLFTNLPQSILDMSFSE